MSEILGCDGQKMCSVKKIESVEPFGSQIMIEMLTPQELLGTTLEVKEDAKLKDAPQAYVLKIGPKLPEDIGLKVGQRILFSGGFIPVPNCDGNHRQPGLIEYHTVKAILAEK